MFVLFSRCCVLFISLFFCGISFPVVASADITQSEREATYKQLEVFSNVLSIFQEN